MKNLLLIAILATPFGLCAMETPASQQSTGQQTIQPFSYDALLALKQSDQFNPKTTALLWDASGVLQRKNKPAAAVHLLLHPWAIPMFTTYIKAKLDKRECMYQWVEDVSTYCAKKSWFRKQSDWKKFLNELITISQMPDLPTAILFMQAKQTVKEGNLGYTAIFSNNGPIAFTLQKDREGFKFLDNAIIITCTKNSDSKPKDAAYAMAKKEALKANPALTTFILIDDTPNNVAGAQKNGIYAILYNNEKDTAGSLYKKLTALELLNDSKATSSTATIK